MGSKPSQPQQQSQGQGQQPQQQNNQQQQNQTNNNNNTNASQANPNNTAASSSSQSQQPKQNDKPPDTKQQTNTTTASTTSSQPVNTNNATTTTSSAPVTTNASNTASTSSSTTSSTVPASSTTTADATSSNNSTATASSHQHLQIIELSEDQLSLLPAIQREAYYKYQQDLQTYHRQHLQYQQQLLEQQRQEEQKKKTNVDAQLKQEQEQKENNTTANNNQKGKVRITLVPRKQQNNTNTTDSSTNTSPQDATANNNIKLSPVRETEESAEESGVESRSPIKKNPPPRSTFYPSDDSSHEDDEQRRYLRRQQLLEKQQQDRTIQRNSSAGKLPNTSNNMSQAEALKILVEQGFQIIPPQYNTTTNTATTIPPSTPSIHQQQTSDLQVSSNSPVSSNNKRTATNKPIKSDTPLVLNSSLPASSNTPLVSTPISIPRQQRTLGTSASTSSLHQKRYPNYYSASHQTSNTNPTTTTTTHPVTSHSREPELKDYNTAAYNLDMYRQHSQHVDLNKFTNNANTVGSSKRNTNATNTTTPVTPNMKLNHSSSMSSIPSSSTSTPHRYTLNNPAAARRYQKQQLLKHATQFPSNSNAGVNLYPNKTLSSSNSQKSIRPHSSLSASSSVSSLPTTQTLNNNQSQQSQTHQKPIIPPLNLPIEEEFDDPNTARFHAKLPSSSQQQSQQKQRNIQYQNDENYTVPPPHQSVNHNAISQNQQQQSQSQQQSSSSLYPTQSMSSLSTSSPHHSRSSLHSNTSSPTASTTNLNVPPTSYTNTSSNSNIYAPPPPATLSRTSGRPRPRPRPRSLRPSYSTSSLNHTNPSIPPNSNHQSIYNQQTQQQQSSTSMITSPTPSSYNSTRGLSNSNSAEYLPISSPSYSIQDGVESDYEQQQQHTSSQRHIHHTNSLPTQSPIHPSRDSHRHSHHHLSQNASGFIDDSDIGDDDEDADDHINLAQLAANSAEAAIRAAIANTTEEESASSPYLANTTDSDTMTAATGLTNNASTSSVPPFELVQQLQTSQDKIAKVSRLNADLEDLLNHNKFEIAVQQDKIHDAHAMLAAWLDSQTQQAEKELEGCLPMELSTGLPCLDIDGLTWSCAIIPFTSFILPEHLAGRVYTILFQSDQANTVSYVNLHCNGQDTTVAPLLKNQPMEQITAVAWKKEVIIPENTRIFWNFTYHSTLSNAAYDSSKFTFRAPAQPVIANTPLTTSTLANDLTNSTGTLPNVIPSNSTSTLPVVPGGVTYTDYNQQPISAPTNPPVIPTVTSNYPIPVQSNVMPSSTTSSTSSSNYVPPHHRVVLSSDVDPKQQIYLLKPNSGAQTQTQTSIPTQSNNNYAYTFQQPIPLTSLQQQSQQTATIPAPPTFSHTPLGYQQSHTPLQYAPNYQHTQPQAQQSNASNRYNTTTLPPATNNTNTQQRPLTRTSSRPSSAAVRSSVPSKPIGSTGSTSNNNPSIPVSLHNPGQLSSSHGLSSQHRRFPSRPDDTQKHIRPSHASVSSTSLAVSSATLPSTTSTTIASGTSSLYRDKSQRTLHDNNLRSNSSTLPTPQLSHQGSTSSLHGHSRQTSHTNPNDPLGRGSINLYGTGGMMAIPNMSRTTSQSRLHQYQQNNPITASPGRGATATSKSVAEERARARANQYA